MQRVTWTPAHTPTPWLLLSFLCVGWRWLQRGACLPSLPAHCSVTFNFLNRDFFNALSAKDQAKFGEMLVKWLAALVCGIPVFVLR